MPQHRGFRAWLKSGNQELEEYEEQQDPHDERVFTCWVSSEVGQVLKYCLAYSSHYRKPYLFQKQFTIHWKSDSTPPPGKAHSGHLTIDGVDMFSKHFSIEREGTRLGKQISKVEMRPFEFSGIKLTGRRVYMTPLV